ncbi:MAG: isochorismatase family cysteine hydrolase [Acetobacteraceae bacterium]|nr:isochorismatase family cysteine hydrolase [Acetobacteraceae bacterium]
MTTVLGLSREVEIDPEHAALLFIDVQNYVAGADGGEYAHLDAPEREATYGFFFRTMRDTAIPNMQRVQAACRAGGIEVLYTVIENLTRDGRDRSLDYKISGLNVPRGSWDGRVIDAIAPGEDEIVLPKTSSSVFISTNIDYVLRNLGVRSLIIAGVLTDQCIDSAVRDACDLGYLVTTVTDACATHSQERHDWSLRNNRGYARQVTTAAMVDEIGRLTAR